MKIALLKKSSETLKLSTLSSRSFFSDDVPFA